MQGWDNMLLSKAYSFVIMSKGGECSPTRKLKHMPNVQEGHGHALLSCIYLGKGKLLRRGGPRRDG
eukprot:5187286-Pleurochrysis_carterae.AAC.1